MRFASVRVMTAVFLLGYSTLVRSQTSGESSVAEQIVEQLVEELEEEVDVDEVLELLRHYRTRPIDLNKTDGHELANLSFLSPLQIASLLAHREQTGKFISVLELQGIAHFDLPTIERLSPFITVSSVSSLEGLTWRKLYDDSEQQLMLRYGTIFQKQRGYFITDSTRSRYLGDANRYMLRYRFNFRNRLRLAINMEKDAGEPFFRERQRYGFDHNGVSLYAKDLGIFKELILGNYALQAGQGLVMWNGLSFGKGAMMTSSARQGGGLRSYTSMNEHNYLSGFATRLSFDNWEITPFVSWRKLSGNRSGAEDGNYTISSISASGLHRTPNELRNRRAIKQNAIGTDVTYRYKRLKLGAVGVYTQYNGTIVHDGSPRQTYSFEGRRILNIGVNYQYTYKNVYLFGETAHEYRRGWATLHGLIASLHPKVSTFVNYRNYQPNYHAVFAQALGEGSAVVNEEGIYAGWMFHPNRKIEWMNYIDVFRFPWLRYRVDEPSAGMDVLSQFTYLWYKIGRISLRYRHRLKQENNSAQPPDRSVVDVLKDQLRLVFQYKLSNQWEIRTRTEGVRYEKDGRIDLGWLAYQDVFWKPARLPLQANVRLAVFATDSYDARLYAYENDVLYASAFPMYNGKGGRSYINLLYRIGRKIDFWLRYSLNHYLDVETVGSGLDQSEGARRSDIKIQFRYRW
ncbi:helix-hairpin-helix domain-containing protein [Sphingobacterium corticibacterium]|uniref:Helix-hairpin-helix domain-containing protein n=1 Tax=Sphingobacterium corticibacterium TaxID=2484746 RepID=A0A4Q6XS29_9SPHI|nr:helix-hairpin-helix domain-containing protein [Sphingobacterium corticibacterium]RZF59539.1 helix-hairpin-helix domain-containing protein [Sphingobacterium corticibacterium]